MKGSDACTGEHGSAPEAPARENLLLVQACGPIRATGDLTLLDAERHPLARESRVDLCRCGGSRGKPYCDGSHASRCFDDPGKLGEPRARPVDDETPSALTIRLRADGPLVLEGRYRLRCADGRELEGASGALCRCGASENKPFCDGRHRDIGFRPRDPSAVGG